RSPGRAGGEVSVPLPLKPLNRCDRLPRNRLSCYGGVMAMVAKQAGVHPPNGLDPAYERAVGSTLPLHRIAGALARARALSLDRALIAGSSPAASHQLTARAAALTSRRFRTSLADGLERMLQAAA